jgi:alpha-N-arabinofuranosidase
MANIAQMINVLQAIILTDETRMVLTPTYHVFDLYQPHLDATLLPNNLHSPVYSLDGENMEAISVSCSADKNGKVSITLVNMDPNNEIKITCRTEGKEAKKVNCKFITSSKITDYNSFDAADVVSVKEISGAKISKGLIEAVLLSNSVVLLQVV